VRWTGIGVSSIRSFHCLMGLKHQLKLVDRIDYVISHHAEQDHSGAIPAVLKRYGDALLVCTPKAKQMLVDHLDVPPERIKTVEDGETLSLGGKTLRFVHTPWVHWPETMVTHLPEDRILFSCDFFGSHLATSDLYAGNDSYVCEAAKRYYAEIMMPFRKTIQNNLKKVRKLAFDFIAPSHGPIYDHPECILSAYEDWVSDRVSNLVVLPYISMHGSTEMMVNYLVAALAEREIKVRTRSRKSIPTYRDTEQLRPADAENRAADASRQAHGARCLVFIQISRVS